MIRLQFAVFVTLLCLHYSFGVVLRAHLFYGASKDCSQDIRTTPYKEVVIDECRSVNNGDEKV